MKKTTIQLSEEFKKWLKKQSREKETYEETLKRLCKTFGVKF